MAGRAGLVGTQNIRNNQSRVGGLDHIAATGTIVEAVDNQPWSGEANVHVSIVDWVKTQDPKLLPEKRRLWSKVDLSLPLLDGTSPKPGRSRVVTPGKRHAMRKDKSYELDSRECDFINSALSDKADVSGAKILQANVRPQRCFQGVVTGYNGFVLSKPERQELLLSDPNSKRVVKPYLVGRDLVSGTGRPTRFVIDFDSVDIYSAQHYEGAFEHVKRTRFAGGAKHREKGRNDRYGRREKATSRSLVAILERAQGTANGAEAIAAVSCLFAGDEAADPLFRRPIHPARRRR